MAETHSPTLIQTSSMLELVDQDHGPITIDRDIASGDLHFQAIAGVIPELLHNEAGLILLLPHA